MLTHDERRNHRHCRWPKFWCAPEARPISTMNARMGGAGWGHRRARTADSAGRTTTDRKVDGLSRVWLSRPRRGVAEPPFANGDMWVGVWVEQTATAKCRVFAHQNKACWRTGWDSNPRYEYDRRLGSINCAAITILAAGRRSFHDRRGRIFARTLSTNDWPFGAIRAVLGETTGCLGRFGIPPRQLRSQCGVVEVTAPFRYRTPAQGSRHVFKESH